MGRPDRLFRLLQRMRELPSPVTAARLAQELQVSQRSIYRDIESLRAAGALIDGERGYGYLLVEDNSLPPQTFNRVEIEAIALGLAHVQTIGDASLATAAISAFAKISSTLPSLGERQLFHAVSQVYRPTEAQPNKVPLDLIRQACWDEIALKIQYIDKAGRESERLIWPLAMMYTDSRLTILAWCTLRQAFRMFHCNQLLSCMKTEISFRPRRAEFLRDYLTYLQSIPTT